MHRVATSWWLSGVLGACASFGCDGRAPEQRAADRVTSDPRVPLEAISNVNVAAPAASLPRVSSAELAGPIRIEPLRAGARPEVFVMRGGPRGPGKLVFLHGMCGHGLGYAQSFAWSAAKKGTLIAPQGDVACGSGPFAKWSADAVGLDARIVETFRTLGFPEPIEDVTVIGYSQGATRAEALARRFPQRYTRVVLMAAPNQALAHSLTSLRGAVTMAGERDRRDLMQASDRALRAVGVPSTFHLIPGAAHGEMGPTPEKTMGAALDWLWDHSRPPMARAE